MLPLQQSEGPFGPSLRTLNSSALSTDLDFLFLNLRQSLHIRAKNDFDKMVTKKVRDLANSFRKEDMVRRLNSEYLGLIDNITPKRQTSLHSIGIADFEKNKNKSDVNSKSSSKKSFDIKLLDEPDFTNEDSVKKTYSTNCLEPSLTHSPKKAQTSEIYVKIKKFLLSPNQVYEERFESLFRVKILEPLTAKWIPKFIRMKRGQMKRCVKALQSLYRNLDRLGLIDFENCVEIFDQAADKNIPKKDFLPTCQELLEVSKFLFLKKILSNGYIPRRFCTNMGNFYLSLRSGLVQDRVYLKFFSSQILKDFFSYELSVPDFSSLFSRFLKLLQELLEAFKNPDFLANLQTVPSIETERSTLKKICLGCKALCPTCNRRCQSKVHISLGNPHHQTVHIDHSLLTPFRPLASNTSQKLESLQVNPKVPEVKDIHAPIKPMTPKHSYLKQSREIRRQSRRVLQKLIHLHELPQNNEISHDLTTQNAKMDRSTSPFFNRTESRLGSDWNWDFLPANKNSKHRERLEQIWQVYGSKLLTEGPESLPAKSPKKHIFFYGDVKNFCGSYAHRERHFEFLLAPNFRNFLHFLQNKIQQALLRMPFLNASNGFSTVFYGASGLLKNLPHSSQDCQPLGKVEVLSKSRPSPTPSKFDFTILADFILEDCATPGAEQAVFFFLFRGLFEFDEFELAALGRLKRDRSKQASAIFFYDYISIKKLKAFANFLNMPVRLCKLDLRKKNKFEQLAGKF